TVQPYTPSFPYTTLFRSIKDVINSSFDFFPEESISFEELKLIQSAIRAKYNTDPIWQGAVDSFVDYTISTGITVSTPVDEINSRSEEHTSELQSRENLVC